MFFINIFELAKDLKEGLLNIKESSNINKVNDYLLDYYICGKSVPFGTFLNIYGHPDCGKTFYCKSLINNNPFSTFIYISGKHTDLDKMGFDNCYVLNSNCIEDIIDFLSKIDSNVVDCIIIDNINNLVRRDEINKDFKSNRKTQDILNQFFKDLRVIAVKLRAFSIISNGILSNNNQYMDYLIKDYSYLSLRFDVYNYSNHKHLLKITSDKNRFNNKKKDIIIDIKTGIVRSVEDELYDL